MTDNRGYSSSNPNFNNNNYETKSNYNNAPPFSFNAPIRAEPQNLKQSPSAATNNMSKSTSGASAQGDWGDFAGLSDKNVRRQFVRKIYSIVTLQLLVTFSIVIAFTLSGDLKRFARSDSGFKAYIASYVAFIFFIVTISIFSCTEAIRKVPMNYILLSGVTLTMSYMLAMIAAYHTTYSVLIAVGITLFIVLGITALAFQTKFDFLQNCWFFVICVSFSMFGFGISCAIVYAGHYFPMMQVVYGGMGALLMAIFLAIDTQLILGNKRYAYSPEDYINAALQLYLDICYIFIYILQLVGAMK